MKGYFKFEIYFNPLYGFCIAKAGNEDEEPYFNPRTGKFEDNANSCYMKRLDTLLARFQDATGLDLINQYFQLFVMRNYSDRKKKGL